MFKLLKCGLIIISMLSCKFDNPKKEVEEKNIKEIRANSFKADYDFLLKYIEIILLEEEKGNGKLAISPSLQARVMTTTANGWSGKGYGWINKKHFISGDTLENINIYGGEERLWFGPEGGQYSIFFKKDAAFSLDNWYTPRLIDLEPFDLIEKTSKYAIFSKTAKLKNYADFIFSFNIKRTISVLSKNEINSVLGLEVSKKISSIGYKTENILKNIGDKPWRKESGLLSIWLLGMLNHTPSTTVVIPYEIGEDHELGPIVNDDYFGKVPSDRLKIDENAIYFKADGQQRGKIGVSPQRAKNLLGSYDEASGSLTIIKYNKPTNEMNYVNSKWEIQDNPFKGDVINSYNDGPPEPGAEPLGPFYELETSSPAAALSVGDTISHKQYTFHFEGDSKELNKISMNLFGISLEEINMVFN